MKTSSIKPVKLQTITSNHGQPLVVGKKGLNGMTQIVRVMTPRLIKWFRVMPVTGEEDHDCFLIHQINRQNSGHLCRIVTYEVLAREGAEPMSGF